MINAELFAQCAELVDALENARRIIHGGDGTLHIDTAEPVLRRAYALLAQSTPEPPKNCWLDDEPDMFPSPCVFDDPDEVINNCTYARTVKCKTDCKYYRVAAHPEPVQATPEPEPPTDEELLAMRSWSSHSHTFDSDLVDFARAVLERWGR